MKVMSMNVFAVDGFVRKHKIISGILLALILLVL